MKRISTLDTLTYWIPIFALLLALLTGCGGGGGGTPTSTPTPTQLPTVSVTSSASEIQLDQTSALTFMFSEVTTGFELGDVSSPQGTLTDLTANADNTAFTVVFTPNDGEVDAVTVQIAAGSYQDAAGNTGLALDSASGLTVLSGCYQTANISTVGMAGVCDGLLIVSRQMLLDAVVTDDGIDKVITHDGTDYSFGDNSYNVFTGQVTDMSELFKDNGTFDGAIGYWDTSRVTDMGEMFGGVDPDDHMDTTYFPVAFNRDIGGWDTGSVTNMSFMFSYAHAFNQDIGGWDTTSVTDVSGMFYHAEAFNRDIGAWNTSSVTDMRGMFAYAVAFNQHIGG